MSEDLFPAEPLLPPLSDEQRVDWLRLYRSENVGPITFRLLVNRYGGARNALEALPDLARRGGGRSIRAASAADAIREIEALARFGGRFVAVGEPDYPVALKHADSAPPLLAIAGRGETLRRPALAIVGSRNASALGRRLTREIAESLGQAGWAIVSGLARGIDTAAHEGSIGSGTVAVLAGGLDRLYPPENAELYARIRAEGVALSEMPMAWQAQARDFPRRNRIVAGIALGVLIVEAADKSGSLITARLAGEMGREVLAVPGHPLDPRAAGVNRLIRDGATLVRDAADVAEAMAGTAPDRLPRIEPILFRAAAGSGGGVEPSDGARARVLEMLGPAPVDIDVLVRESGVDAATVAVVLIELDLAGRLERHPGHRVALGG
jgi:DNA processing protein